MIKRFMPFIGAHYINGIDNDVFHDLQMPPDNKMVVITTYMTFLNLVPGTITNFNKRRIYFNSLDLVIENSTLRPDEFINLLQGCIELAIVDASLTQPMAYSEIWHLLRYCKTIHFDMDNLICDDKMPTMLDEITWFVPREELSLFNIDLCREKVSKVVDHFLMSTDKPLCQFKFNPGYSISPFENMVKYVEEKLKAAGYVVETDVGPATCKGMIGFWKTSDTEISLRHVNGNLVYLYL
uniref:FBA_2 domain-containing protein n=1 Tax=Panagrellus redivivus TaxID=6233 RepID=A0A7E4ZUE7_PANRE